MIGTRYIIFSDQVAFERLGYGKPTEVSPISVDVYVEFLSILKIDQLKSHYMRPILDGWTWSLEKDGEEISNGINKLPKEVRNAITYLSEHMDVSFIPTLPPENDGSSFRVLLE